MGMLQLGMQPELYFHLFLLIIFNKRFFELLLCPFLLIFLTEGVHSRSLYRSTNVTKIVNLALRALSLVLALTVSSDLDVMTAKIETFVIINFFSDPASPASTLVERKSL